MGHRSGRAIVVTGCDANHFDLASDLLASLRDIGGMPYAVGFVHLGSGDLPDAIAGRVDLVASVDDTDFSRLPRAGFAVAYLGVKARLPELFPGFDTYVWLDADTWVQNADGLHALVRASAHADVVLVPECDIMFFQVAIPHYRHVATYHSLFPDADLPTLLRHQMINAGVFAAATESALWTKWSDLLDDARDRGETNPTFYYGDQVPLHCLIYQGQITMTPLPALNNWQVWAMTPKIDLQRRRLVSPFWPFEEINIIHLAGDSKDTTHSVGQSDRRITFRYRDVSALFDEAQPAADFAVEPESRGA